MIQFNRLVAAVALAASSLSAVASAVNIDFSGYWLETVGTNTINLAGGGSAGGTVSTLFIAQTTPTAAGGTTATARYADSSATTAPVLDSPTLWARRVLNPTDLQKQGLIVDFSNGTDTTTFVGRDLRGLQAMPLVQNLFVDPTGQPFGPLITWDLPLDSLGGIDLVQLVFYNDDTNLEVGTRQLLASTATSFDISDSALPEGFNLVVNVRLIDLFDPQARFSNENIQRASRSYVTYTARAEVPTPGSAALAGIALFALVLARRRRGAA